MKGDPLKKAEINFWLNASSFFVFLWILFTGFVLKWVVPSHCGDGGGWKGGVGEFRATGDDSSRWFLGIHRSDWVDIHFSLALFLMGLVVMHLIFHWDWIVNNVNSRVLQGPFKG